MKKILITGKNSYVGKSLERWLKNYPGRYLIDSISLKDDSWKGQDFSKYDVVFHVAAVVHKEEKAEMKDLYYKVNRDLSIEVARKAKSSGVTQFIFMSTMAVYGKEGEIDEEVVITKETEPNPITYYGISKMEAENELMKLVDERFKVVVLRPPMIYGVNCPGNYARLEKLALKTPVFPFIKNKRSMLHVDKLCEDVKGYIDYEVSGLFLPQDNEYVNTSLLVKEIAEKNGKKLVLSNSLGFFVKTLGKRNALLNKVFGNLIYDK